MASAVLSLFLIGLANVVLGQEPTPSPASVVPSVVTASGSPHATHIVTVGKVRMLQVCKHGFREG